MGKNKAILAGNLTDLDIRQLRIFSAVVEAGGYTAAELTLNLANSTISNHMSNLEKRLDMKLCERGRSGFRLTEQGMIVYEATRNLLGSMEAFKEVVNQSHDQILGTLTLALAEHIPGIHDGTIVQALELFAEKAPKVALSLATIGSDEVEEAVLQRRADIGITVLSRANSALATTPLFNETMHLYAAHHHPLHQQQQVTLEQVRAWGIVESPRMVAGREPDKIHQNWPITARAHQQESRIALLLTGKYTGYLPEHFVSMLGYNHKLKPLLPDVLSYTNEYHAIRKRPLANQRIVNLFMDELEQSCATTMPVTG
ncbi:LysR family transcriptional regulator [Salinimonas lutimaris]|uniref:LysR family transcriptional regulator n=1 Tax=Salinimonas lutimaris TaxID=914153 RepID=UPI0010C06ABB|nr:LysR family transcriptional regulator [Salinimonas lutimaris]